MNISPVGSVWRIGDDVGVVLCEPTRGRVYVLMPNHGIRAFPSRENGRVMWHTYEKWGQAPPGSVPRRIA